MIISILAIIAIIYSIFLFFDHVTKWSEEFIPHGANYIRFIIAHPPRKNLHKGANVFINAAFYAMFGRSHFTWFCLYRSMLFTLFGLLLLIVFGIAFPSEFFGWRWFFAIGDDGLATQFLLWYAIIVWFEYFNLYKTRHLIRLVGYFRMRLWPILLILSLDIASTFLAFIAAYLINAELSIRFLIDQSTIPKTFYPHFASILEGLKWVVGFYIVNASSQLRSLPDTLAHPLANEQGIETYSALMTCLLFWLFVTGTLISATIIRVTEIVVRGLRRAGFDVEKNPYRAAGAVASVMVSLLVLLAWVLWHIFTS